MSVLNTMLRDLERRGERLPLSLAPQHGRQEAKPEPVAAPLAPPLISATEPRHRGRPVRPTFLLAAVAGAAAAAWLWLHPASALRATAGEPAKAPQAAAPAAAAATVAVAIASPSQTEAAATPVQAPPATPKVEPLAAEPLSDPSPAAVASQPMHPHTPTPALSPVPPQTAAAKPRAEADPAAAPSESAVAPSAAQTELERAMQMVARGRTTEAAELLAAAVSERPAWSEARSTLAALQAEAGDRQHALVTLIDGVAYDPRRFATMAAQLQAELGDPAGALSTLDRVPAQARDQTYHGLAAAVAQRAGQHELAVAEYAAALRFGPSNSVAWVGLGLSLQALGRNVDALAAYRNAAGGTLSTDLRRFTQERMSELQATAGRPAQ
jgi:MSHA biogenesis protein MshN